jgi:TonB family protein
VRRGAIVAFALIACSGDAPRRAATTVAPPARVDAAAPAAAPSPPQPGSAAPLQREDSGIEPGATTEPPLAEAPPAAISPGAELDEVACWAAAGGCRPPAANDDDDGSGLPRTIDTAMVKAGILPLRATALACGDAHPGVTGMVKVQVQVAPDGTVTRSTVVTSPEPALGRCVAAAFARATFARTQQGGSFKYPINFQPPSR